MDDQQMNPQGDQPVTDGQPAEGEQLMPEVPAEEAVTEGEAQPQGEESAA